MCKGNKKACKKDNLWFNGIYPYFKMLKKINELLILLIENNTNIEEQEDRFFDLTSELMRILPFKLERDKKTNIIVKIELQEDAGILLLKKYFRDLEKDYKNIVDTNFVELVQIIKIRNKYIHEPHNIKCVCFACGQKNTIAGFKYKKEYLELNTKSLLEIIKELNTTFEKIKIKFKDEVNKLNEEDRNHPYVLNILNNYFEDYNNVLIQLMNDNKENKSV